MKFISYTRLRILGVVLLCSGGVAGARSCYWVAKADRVCSGASGLSTESLVTKLGSPDATTKSDVSFARLPSCAEVLDECQNGIWYTHPIPLVPRTWLFAISKRGVASGCYVFDSP